MSRSLSHSLRSLCHDLLHVSNQLTKISQEHQQHLLVIISLQASNQVKFLLSEHALLLRTTHAGIYRSGQKQKEPGGVGGSLHQGYPTSSANPGTHQCDCRNYLSQCNKLLILDRSHAPSGNAPSVILGPIVDYDPTLRKCKQPPEVLHNSLASPSRPCWRHLDFSNFCPTIPCYKQPRLSGSLEWEVSRAW